MFGLSITPRVRLYGAWVMLALSLVGWLVSIFTFAKDEPITILSLSWFAITLTAYDIITTADVRVKQEEEETD